MNLKDSCVLVTGGAGGVGVATARRLLAAGCTVMLWDLSKAGLERAASLLAGEGHSAARVLTRVVDITDPDSVHDAVERTLSGMGRIDVLVNNAGHLAAGGFLDQPPEVWRTTVDVNLCGLINVTRAVLPHLYERNSGQVVNVSSASSFVGVSGLAVYSATKWAVWGITEALRHEVVNDRRAVRFSSVHPNYISRGMFEGARIRGLGGLLFPRLSDHDVVAKAIVEHAIRRGRRVVRRPRSLRLAILLRGLLPETLFSWAARRLQVHTSMQSWTGPAGGRQ